MKHILYLAGGNSRRFGENKLLYELEGKPLYRHGLDMLVSLIQTRDDCTLTVVSRYDEVLDGARACGVRAVYSPESEKGQSYTIRAGLDAAQPGVVCARVGFGERRGNPALFSAALVPALRALRGDGGGRPLLLRPDCVLVQAGSERELYDIDTRDSVQ